MSPKTRDIWVIRDLSSGAWVTSSKHLYFGDFEAAALFHQRENAEKAVKDMARAMAARPLFGWALYDKHAYESVEHVSAAWAARGGTYSPDGPEAARFVFSPRPVLEVVRCEISVAQCPDEKEANDRG